MAINPKEIDIKNIIELVQSSSIKDDDLLVVGQGIYARKSTVLELYNKFGVPSILTSLNSLQFQINQLNNTVGNSVLYSPQTKTAQQKSDARNNLDVYSRTETQTVVNSAIINLGNVVNSVTGVNVDNTDPKNPIVAEFRPIADYNNDMLLKADIDGNLTIGGIWWQDQVLSDRFANYKQVWTALSNNTIEWGNIELDKHIFLVDDINGVKIKVGSTEGTIWNTLNLTNVSQLNNDAGYLQSNDLDGFIYDVQYNSANHQITFYQQNEPNLVIDLDLETLLKDIDIVNIGGIDYLRLYREDGTYKDVPLNSLLVGVVKSVNGLTPNSQGEIILNVTNIPNLSSELANKLDIRMAGLVSNLNATEQADIRTKLGIVNNIVQTLGLSGNTITLSGGGGSISLNIANIGGLQTALDAKANIDASNISPGNAINWRTNLGVYSTTQVDGFLAGKANTSGYYSGLHVGLADNSTLWNGQTYSTVATGSPSLFMVYDSGSFVWRASNISETQNALGITTALNLNLQQVTNNGNITTLSGIFKNLEVGFSAGAYKGFNLLQDYTFFNTSTTHGLGRILTNGLLTTDDISDASLIPTNGIYSKGQIATLNDGNSTIWNAKLGAGANISLLNNDVGYITSASLSNYVSKLNVNESIQGIKSFTGLYTEWLLNGNSNNAQGFIQSTSNIFAIGTQNNKNVSFFHNLIEKGYFDAGGLNVLGNIYTTSYGSADIWNSKANPDGSNITNIPAWQSALNIINYTQGSNISIVGGVISNTAPNATHTGDVTGATALTIANNAVTFPKMQNIGTQTFLGRVTAGTGNIESLTIAQMQAALGITAVNNGSFTVQGTGSITGLGSTSANASANTSATLDLTAQTKADISEGKQAGKQISDLFSSLSVYFQYHDVSGGGTTIDPNEAFFNLVNPKSTSGISVEIITHSVHGARLVLQGVIGGSSGNSITYTGRFINRNGANVNSIVLENNNKEYVWDVDADRWREVF